MVGLFRCLPGAVPNPHNGAVMRNFFGYWFTYAGIGPA